MKNLGKRRRELGLSVSEVATSSGIMRDELLRMEQGRKQPTREDLKKLAIPLKAEVGDFTSSCGHCDGTGYKVAPGLIWRDQ